MFIDFTQNPLVKGIIQSKTIEESRISYAMFSELVNSHFKSLKAHCESKILKPSSKISSERQTSIVETTIAEPNLIESNDLQPANGKITNELIQLRQ